MNIKSLSNYFFLNQHRDLRTPNILINENLECKIADFGISDNEAYQELSHEGIIYVSLQPPECRNKKTSFGKKGDIYFYGWVLEELYFGKKPNEDYNSEYSIQLLNEINPNETIREKQFKSIIINSLQELI